MSFTDNNDGTVTDKTTGLMRQQETMLCAFCGVETTGKKYCDIICQRLFYARKDREEHRARHPMLNIDCVICGETIPDNKRRDAKVCSMECDDKHRLVKSKARRMLRKEANPINVTCRCGKTFQTQYKSRTRCRSKECNEQIRKQGEKRPAMENSPEIKRKYYPAKPVIVNAKCPGCGQMHKKRIQVAWLGNGVPRYNCERYPGCMVIQDTWIENPLQVNLPGLAGGFLF